MGICAGGSSSCTRDRRRGQTEVLGVVLLLGMTIVGATAIVAFGATALDDARDSAGNEGVGHAMTQFDSRAAIVALDDDGVQSIRLGGGGSYHTLPDAGWLNVSHENESTVEPFLNTTLGAVVYRSDDVEIAYQGGGVWRKQGSGSVMVSPPEFHYRGETLTLPLIQVRGNASASGPIRASLTNEQSAHPVFPNASRTYRDSDQRYANPVTEGNVTVTVNSEYYQAWAEYFRARSDGEVMEHAENNTVTLTLETGGALGDFDVPAVGDSISVTGMAEPHSINDFSVTIHSDANGNPFNNRHWSFHSAEDGQEFELHMFSPDGCNGGGHSGELHVGIYYYDGTGTEYHGWENETIDAGSNDDFEVNCADQSITMDFTGDTVLNYDSINANTGNAGWEYASQINGMSLESTATFDQHSAHDDDGARDGTYTAGDTESIGFLVNHYMSLLGPTFELETNEGPGNSEEMDPGSSTGRLDYDQTGGNLITFLHVTENRIRVEFR